MGAKENDLNPNVYIGLELPLKYSSLGYFNQTKTTIEQTVHNLKNLLLTIPGERVGQPEFGSKLYHVLFEQNKEETLINKIDDVIREAVKIWLPYVIINQIIVSPNTRLKNNLDIEINFSITLDPDRFRSITLSVTSPTI